MTMDFRLHILAAGVPVNSECGEILEAWNDREAGAYPPRHGSSPAGPDGGLCHWACLLVA